MNFYQQLLDATQIERGLLLGSPVIQQALSGDVSLTRYLAFLGQAYHHVRHTVPLLMSCGSHLRDDQTWLQPALIDYINEEVGHEQWILNDITAAGGDQLETLDAGPAFETELMVAYAYDSIRRNNPLSFLGMVHVLEGTSTALATQAAAKIQASLGLPDNAFSYLSSHGELDLEHVKAFEQLVNRISDPDDQRAIIHSARAHYRLYAAMISSL
ncbi:MAG: long-chain acyl-CoA synthetase [Motiliproteus sp.]|jgi:long-chain acyl-CoA synthetase